MDGCVCVRFGTTADHWRRVSLYYIHSNDERIAAEHTHGSYWLLEFVTPIHVNYRLNMWNLDRISYEINKQSASTRHLVRNAWIVGRERQREGERERDMTFMFWEKKIIKSSMVFGRDSQAVPNVFATYFHVNRCVLIDKYYTYVSCVVRWIKLLFYIAWLELSWTWINNHTHTDTMRNDCGGKPHCVNAKAKIIQFAPTTTTKSVWISTRESREDTDTESWMRSNSISYTKWNWFSLSPIHKKIGNESQHNNSREK